MSQNPNNTVGAVLDLLDSISSFSLQESWDNSGLQIGSRDFIFDEIYTSLEVDFHMLSKIKENSLIIAHHPLFFKPIKSLNFLAYPANIAKELINKNCSLISTHTNFDKTHLNKSLAKTLDFEIDFESDFVIFSRCKKEKTLDIAREIKSKLSSQRLDPIKITQSTEFTENIALTCGSGGGLIPKIAEIATKNCLQNLLFLTGDVKYHDAMHARAIGINIMDIGHFESEQIFAKTMQQILSNNGYKAIICNSQPPFYT